MLESLGEHKREDEVINQNIVHHLSGDIDIKQSTIFFQEDLTRATIDKVLRERYLKLNNDSAGGGRALLCLPQV